MVSASKRLDGFWSNDLLNGQGRIIESAYMHKGYFIDGKREGYGIEKSVSGNSYNGEFKDDKRCGKGKHVNKATG